MNKMKNIKINLLLLLSFILLTFTLGITIAFFSSRGYFENKFKASAYDVYLEEEFYNDWGTKKINIINNDTTPVVLRVSYNELWSEKILESGGGLASSNQASGSLLSFNDNSRNYTYLNDTATICRSIDTNNDQDGIYILSNIINGEEVVTKNWSPTWNDFYEGPDGWYYYNKVLNSSDNIQILESISLREDLISNSSCYQDYSNYEYELSFNYEVIQATELAIKDIWDYDVTINEGDITWPF